MLVRRLLPAIVVGALVAAIGSAAAQAAPRRPAAPFETDRPDFVESSLVVPRGWLQIETGLTFENAADGSQSLATETLLRYGAGAHLEWRLGVPGFTMPSGTGHSGFGHGDVYAGIKWQLGPLGDLEAGLIAAVTIPLGDPSATSGGWDPEVAATASTDLPGGFDIAAMLLGALPTQEGQRNATMQASVTLGRELSPAWHAFLEGFATSSRHGTPGYLAHIGVTWQLSDDTQFDAHAGRAIAGDVPESFVAVGFSIRVPLGRQP